MPLDPINFLEVADRLKDDPNEAFQRTSVGRSYYAVFLYFRDYLNSKGISKQIEPKKDIHDFVINCLSYSDTSIGSKVGQKLRELRQYRREADYNLKDSIKLGSAGIFQIAKSTVDEFRQTIRPPIETALVSSAKKFAQTKGWMA